ncbi:MAG: tyrosine-protein phosphatase [Anaerorhabdus sp.]
MSLKSVINFRELGGIKTIDNKKVKSNVLFRSGALDKLSVEEAEKIKDEYNIKNVIDMRASYERVNEDKIDNVNKYICDFFKDKPYQAPSLKSFLSDEDTSLSMISIYQDMVRGDVGIVALSDFFKILLNCEDSVLWHCTAGKDRTGVSCAILLELLNVDRDSIMENYLLSNKSNEQLLNIIKEKYPQYNNLDDALKEKFTKVIGVKKEYLNTVWDIIDSTYGNVEKFAKDKLNLTSDDILKLRAKYLQ